MYAIEARGLTKRYGANLAVDDVSFSVEPGAIFGFLGPNGSGKSTTVRMLCGLVAPTAGHALIEDVDIARAGRSARRRFGYMAQGFALYDDLSCDENLEFCARAYGLNRAVARQRKHEVVELSGIGRYLRMRAGELSGGWQRRLGLAAALLHDPAVVFLDEPTAGIDPIARRELWETFAALAAQGKTFFITTHDLDEARRCSRIGYIFEGELLVCGSMVDICCGEQASLEDALVSLVRRTGA